MLVSDWILQNSVDHTDLSLHGIFQLQNKKISDFKAKFNAKMFAHDHQILIEHSKQDFLNKCLNERS